VRTDLRTESCLSSKYVRNNRADGVWQAKTHLGKRKTALPGRQLEQTRRNKRQSTAGGNYFKRNISGLVESITGIPVGAARRDDGKAKTNTSTVKVHK